MAAGHTQSGEPPEAGKAMAVMERSGDASKTRRKEAETVQLPALPRAPNFRSWKMAVRSEIAGASGDPHIAFQWILKVEKDGASADDFEDSGGFPSLGAKLAAAITKMPRAT